MLPPAVIEKSEFTIPELGEKPFWAKRAKGARVIWMGDSGKPSSTGFSKISDRQVGI